MSICIQDLNARRIVSILLCVCVRVVWCVCGVCVCVAALSLVWNLMLAPKFHGETITRQSLVATTIICIGVTSSVIFSSHGYIILFRVFLWHAAASVREYVLLFLT